jgi:uncharacterized membrane protein YqjE
MTQTQAQTSAAALQANKTTEIKLEEKGTLVKEEKFQEYKSSLTSIRLITKGGIKITFTKFKLYTQSPAVIAYLDDEIKNGLPGITKGALLTLDEVNPMATLRREVKAELLEELKQEAADNAAGVTRNMGETALQNLKALNASQVAK